MNSLSDLIEEIEMNVTDFSRIERRENLKVVKIRLDNVLARQLEEFSDSLQLTLADYCQLCVLQKTAEIRDAFKKAKERKEGEVQETSEA